MTNVHEMSSNARRYQRRGPKSARPFLSVRRGPDRSDLFYPPMRSRDVRLLIAQSMELSYEHIAAITGVKKSSVGTLLARAQSTFERKYRREYGGD